MIAFFGLNATKIAMRASGRAAGWPRSPAQWRAHSCPGCRQRSLIGLSQLFWWIHALVLLAFLNYLPYSKHMHILTAIPNCFFRSLEKVNTQPRERFEKGNSFRRGDRWTSSPGKPCSTPIPAPNAAAARTSARRPPPASR